MKYPKPLISSFFKFLTYITEFQLTHVFCMTSDVLFMEDVAFHILSNEVNYILVDDFDKETTLKFMDFFSKEKLNRTLTNEEKELIYSYVGGNPMDIIWVIDNMRIHDLKESLDKFLKIESSKLRFFLEKLKWINEKEYNEVVNVLSLFKEEFEIDSDNIPHDIRELLVKKYILFIILLKEK